MKKEDDYIPNLKIQDFLEKYYKNSIIYMCDHYPKERSIEISFIDLHNYDSKIADNLLISPMEIIEKIENELHHLEWLPQQMDISKSHIRIRDLLENIPIRNLRSKDLNHLIAIEGMIRKSTGVHPKIKVAAYKCFTCENIMYLDQNGSKLRSPSVCTNELCKKKDTLKLIENLSLFEDSQRVLIQESPESIRNGTNPQSLDVLFVDDLAGNVSPGDRVIIIGILNAIQKTSKDGKSLYYDLYLKGNNITKLDKEFDELSITKEDKENIIKLSKEPNLYNRMIQSIAPSIYGTKILKDVKQAILLQLFSGVRKKLLDGSTIRGDIHILLVGDPGVAKSQLLRYVVNLSPRGVYASGKGSTASGLTASVVKDDLGEGRWSIEGGALVMANNGIATIDEMDKMKDEDRSALHEAMEQQTISIAKAGLIATLKSQCSILGASNPKSGRFNITESISEQIDMPPSLLSRFDLIYILTDEPNENIDTEISKHILKSHYIGELLKKEDYEKVEKELVEDLPIIEKDLLQKYIAYAKMYITPIMTKEARDHLQNFYTNVRKLGKKSSTIPLTARQLEALIRIAEASAKIRLSNEVTIEDAKRSTQLTSDCLKQIGVDPETGNYDIDYIVAGEWKSKKDQIQILKSSLVRLAFDAKGNDILMESVLQRAKEMGVQESHARELLEMIHQKGGYIDKGMGYIHPIKDVLDSIY